MTQAQWLLLTLKVGVPLSGLALLGWVVEWTLLSKAASSRHKAENWRDPVGVTFLLKTLFLVGLLAFTTVTLFLSPTRVEAEVLAWGDAVLILAIAPVMVWRGVLFWHRFRVERSTWDGGDSDSLPGDSAASVR